MHLGIHIDIELCCHFLESRDKLYVFELIHTLDMVFGSFNPDKANSLDWGLKAGLANAVQGINENPTKFNLMKVCNGDYEIFYDYLYK